MEIISDPNDTDNDVACSSNEVLVQRFEPLSNFNRKKLAMKFNFLLRSIDKVEYTGEANELNVAPLVTTKATGNGTCLFNSLSILLNGKELYNTFIHHAVCNYISDARN